MIYFKFQIIFIIMIDRVHTVNQKFLIQFFIKYENKNYVLNIKKELKKLF